MVTPELVNPISVGNKVPELNFPQGFIKDTPTNAPRHPSSSGTENAPLLIKRDVVPIEELITSPQGNTSPAPTLPATNQGSTGSSNSDQRSNGRPNE